jgi:hypothetical protein
VIARVADNWGDVSSEESTPPVDERGRPWWALWPALVLVAVVVAVGRGLEVAAAFYAGVLIVDVVAALTLGRRTNAWWGMGRHGSWRIGWSWAPVAICHWTVAIAFYLGPDEIGATLVMVAGLPAFLTAGTAFSHLRYMKLIGESLGRGESLLAICTGLGGRPPGYAVLAATDRRVIGFTQTSRVRARLEQFDSVDRREIIELGLERDADVVQVVARTAERELGVTHAGLTMAESFVQQARSA